MKEHDTVVSSSRLQVVLLSVRCLKSKWLAVVRGRQLTPTDDSVVSILTGKMGENGQSLDRVAKPCTDQTVGC